MEIGYSSVLSRKLLISATLFLGEQIWYQTERDQISPIATLASENSRSEIDLSIVDTVKPVSLSKPTTTDLQNVTTYQLFRYATPRDICMMFFGSIAAVANGSSMPLMTIVFSDVIQAFVTFTIVTSKGFSETAKNDLEDAVVDKVILFLILGGVVFVAAYFQMVLWMISGENQAKRLRQIYYHSILRQDIAYFDSNSTGDVTSRISSDINLFQEGVSEKIGVIIQNLSTFVAGFVIGFTKVLPLLATASGIMGKFLAASSKDGQDAYAKAGSIAEQALSGIRTVTAFGGQERELRRYVDKLQDAYIIGRKKAIITGSSLAFIFFTLFSTYALAFWYGGILIADGKANGGQVVNVFFSVLIGAFSLGNTAPNLTALANARGAAKKLFSVIDRVPVIDSSDPSGLKLKSVKGRLEFRNIDFSYPSRPDVQVLKNFNLTIEPGQTVALVGSSGSGKSTIVGLLERFYNPLKGQIFIDGEDIKNINIKSMRSKIGLVGQEPVLFPQTIKQNVAWGAVPDDPEPTLDEIIDACKKSNAHEFIMDLPDKYETEVGEKGSLMSGGQKQRIAIARALIKNPSILLLDEATSALDTESERLVQDALDSAATDRTTIVIAHRLSTIKNADKIVVMSKGEIMEIGRHDELIAKGAFYHKDEMIKINVENEKKMTDLRKLTTKASTAFSLEIKESAIFPFFSIIFSSILNSFSKTDVNELRRSSNLWALMFFILAVIAFIANFMQQYFFILSGEKLTKRLRSMTFEALLKQEIGFFDDENNGTGILTSRLATDATKVDGLTGTLMGSILQSITNLIVGLTIAFVYGWKLTLVILASTPAIIASGFLQMQALAGFSAKTASAYDKSSQIVQQSVSNIRTIASLTRENTFKHLYGVSLQNPHKIAVKGSMVSSIGFGLSNGLLFYVYALAFWYGSRLVGAQEYTTGNMMKVLFAVVFCAIAAGQASTFAPNTAKAKVSALSIFELLDRKSNIDPTQNEGKDRPTPVIGTASIHNANFNYPARPNLRILRGLDLSILTGKTVALVGGSGSGKSTVVSLLLRFYDVRKGDVNVEDVNVKQWNLEYLRRNMALVGQEPVLFDLSIGDNIAYGKEGCTQEEIVEAAKKANIHNFIMGLPEGYNTSVGERGTQLSGGQKQRIAIARALIRNPKILLLDEATSALDSESEKVVQDALDKASANHTTITIAHRLSTIQNADLILVVKKGRIAEQGKHFDLIAKRGLYYELVNKQMLNGNN
ncbi:11792_t:CDS:10 [Diversispora eburnea]|uniref:11792_t:CDS:1 n=1 Tax=Diversispora eburnea TaxID=1213867 RepID=A0A9N8VKQ3_9GLOM|nr:11792_t:CDS:10 [Diversispora eburnea]